MIKWNQHTVKKVWTFCGPNYKKNKKQKKRANKFSSKKAKPWKDISSDLHASRCILFQKNDLPSGYSVPTRTRRGVSWILTRSSEFFLSFWSWNSSSLKLDRSFDSSTYSILKIYRLCHSPSFAALIMVVASFPHLFVAIFRSVPEKKSYPHL